MAEIIWGTWQKIWGGGVQVAKFFWKWYISISGMYIFWVGVAKIMG